MAKKTWTPPNPSLPLWLGVSGRPILHSKSPQLFQAAFRHVGMDGIYLRLAAPSASEALWFCQELPLRGLNVTAPFKSEIMAGLNEIDAAAQQISAINTILVDSNGRLQGLNTDAPGLIDSLAANGMSPTEKNCFVLGAGGAARAMVYALLRQAARVTIINRSDSRAKALANDFGCQWCPSAELPRVIHQAQLIINTASHDLAQFDPGTLQPSQVLFDINYQSGTTSPLMRRLSSARLITGESLLLHQARHAFGHFCGWQPQPEIMAAGLAATPVPAPLRRIALIGFMGSGKTTVGRLLAGLLGWDWVDSDDAIEQHYGETVSAIFQQHGEGIFRRRESAILSELLQRQQLVISCGGGLLDYPHNQEMLRQNSLPIWLFARLPTCLARTAGSHRPLLVNQSTQAIKQRYQNRLATYARTSQLVLSSDQHPAAEIAGYIHEELKQAFGNWS